MWLLYYYLRTRFACLRRHKSFRQTSIHYGKVMYRDYKGDDKKGILQVLHELNILSRYWKCFPDSYFRFAMFKKEYDDMGLMKTYVPQGAYGRYRVNRNPRYQILIDDKILFHDIMTHHFFAEKRPSLSNGPILELVEGVGECQCHCRRDRRLRLEIPRRAGGVPVLHAR